MPVENTYAKSEDGKTVYDGESDCKYLMDNLQSVYGIFHEGEGRAALGPMRALRVEIEDILIELRRAGRSGHARRV